jgi:hypothetical protein
MLCPRPAFHPFPCVQVDPLLLLNLREIEKIAKGFVLQGQQEGQMSLPTEVNSRDATR